MADNKILKLTEKERRPQRQKHTKESFTTESIKIHGGKFSYESVDWVNGVTKVQITCPIHGSFVQYPFHHLTGKGCKKCGIEARTAFNAVPHKKLVESIKRTTKPEVFEALNIDTYSNFQLHCSTHGFVKISKRDLNHSTCCPKCRSRKLSLDEWTVYKQAVRTITERQWREKQSFFNHQAAKRGKFEYHIDHQFSVRRGFEETIPPYIIGHWTNLWMLPWQDNLQKNDACVISKELLLKNYFWAIKHFNEIK